MILHPIGFNSKSSGSVPEPSFAYFGYDAATYELDDTLDSDRVAVINVLDADGVYQQVATTKVAYVGARHSGGVQYADDGTGMLLDPQPYAVSAPQGTNGIRNSTTLSGSPWSFSYADAPTLEVAPSGVSRWKLVANQTYNSAPAAMMDAAVSIAAGSDFVISACVELGASTCRYFVMYLVNWGTNTGGVFDMQTGQYVGHYSNFAGFGEAGAEPIAGGYRFWGKYTSPSDGGGRGSFGVSRDTDGTAVELGGILWISDPQIELNTLTLPIKTAGAAASRDKDVIAAPIGNLNQQSNSGYLEVDVATGSTPAILGAFLSFDGTNYNLFDGTTTVSVAGTVGEHKLGWYAGGGTMNLCVDGTWGTEAVYDGTLAAALGVFTDASYVQGIRNWKLWDEASQAAIDAEMTP